MVKVLPISADGLLVWAGAVGGGDAKLSGVWPIAEGVVIDPKLLWV